jgi:hypothetical protein
MTIRTLLTVRTTTFAALKPAKRRSVGATITLRLAEPLREELSPKLVEFARRPQARVDLRLRDSGRREQKTRLVDFAEPRSAPASVEFEGE